VVVAVDLSMCLSSKQMGRLEIMPVSEQGRSIGLRRRNKLLDVYTSYYDSSNLVESAVPLLSQSEVVWPLLMGFCLVQGQYVFQMGQGVPGCSLPLLKEHEMKWGASRHVERHRR
jgi:hypothetical protein